MNNIKPTFDHVFVTLESATKSDIIIPDGAEKADMHGRVLAVGPDCKQVSKGDAVLFSPGGAMKFTREGKMWYLMREEFVMCRIVDKVVSLS